MRMNCTTYSGLKMISRFAKEKCFFCDKKFKVKDMVDFKDRKEEHKICKQCNEEISNGGGDKTK